MQELIAQGDVRTYGYGSLVAWARFVPSGSTLQTINNATGADSFGIKSITRNSAGNWTVALQDRPPNFIVLTREIEDDTTTYHFVRLESLSLTAGTFVVTHKSVAFASVASGPAASDTVDGIQIFVFARQPIG